MSIRLCSHFSHSVKLRVLRLVENRANGWFRSPAYAQTKNKRPALGHRGTQIPLLRNKVSCSEPESLPSEAESIPTDHHHDLQESKFVLTERYTILSERKIIPSEHYNVLSERILILGEDAAAPRETKFDPAE